MTKRRPSPALVVAMLALFMSLTGTVTAHQSKNHVGSLQLKPRAVGPIHIKKNAVRPFQLAGNSVRSFQLAPNSVRGSHVVDGAIGSAHLGAGSVGASQLGTIVERTGGPVNVVNGSQSNVTATCQAGEIAIAGGNEWSALNTGVRLQRITRDGNGFNVAGANDSGVTRQLTALAYCLQP